MGENHKFMLKYLEAGGEGDMCSYFRPIDRLDIRSIRYQQINQFLPKGSMSSKFCRKIFDLTGFSLENQ